MNDQLNSNSIRKMGGAILFALSFLMANSQSNENNTNEDYHCESPYFVVFGDENNIETLPLKSTNIEVNIAGVIADVTVNQTYTNTGQIPIEAKYVFPASTHAAVYKMIMKINEREITAIVEEKEKARNLYETAKKEGKTASLLEEQRPNVFEMNVANILPGAKIEVSLSYTELMVPKESTYEFVYPTVVGPRYISPAEHETEKSDTWIQNPYMNEGDKSTTILDVVVNLNTGINLKEVKCNTHKNSINFLNKKSAIVTLNEKDGGNKDFILHYKLAGEEIETGFITYKDENGENYFLTMIEPPLTVKPEQITQREYVFIIDVSGSMSGFPLDISKTLMKNLLSRLKTTDKFNIVFFAGGSEVFSESSVFANQANTELAINYLEKLSGSGGTELMAALQKSMQLNSDENYARTFIILTDGYVSVEKEAFDYIRSNLNNANFFSFGIGSSVNRYILKGMAHMGNGEPYIATNPTDAKALATKLINDISSPVLTGINIKINGLNAYDVIPEKYPDLFAQKPLIISGKFKGEASGKINITGSTGGGLYSEAINIDSEINTQQLKAIKYLWAREKIKILSDYNHLSHEVQTKEQIIKTGKDYNLLTEFTSFVAIDSDTSYKSGKLQTINQELPLPKGVSELAISNRVGLSAPSPQNSVEFYTTTDSDLSMEYLSLDEVDEEVEESMFIFVEKMPTFKGQPISEFQKYVQANIKYPLEAANLCISGKVYIQFVVDEKGNVTEVKVIRGVDELLDNEAIRVVRNSPKWTPGEERGRKVKVSFVIPVNFVLASK